MIMMTVMVMIIMVVTMIIIMILKHWCNYKQQKKTYLTPNLPAQNQYGSSGVEPKPLQSVIGNIK